jgi:hypothetical protein
MLHALQPALRSRRLPPEVVARQAQELRALLRECYEGEDCGELCDLVDALAELEEEACAQAAERVAEAANAQVSAYFAARIAEHAELREFLDEVRARA